MYPAKTNNFRKKITRRKTAITILNKMYLQFEQGVTHLVLFVRTIRTKKILISYKLQLKILVNH